MSTAPTAPTALITLSGKADKTTGDFKLDTFTPDSLWASIGAAQDQHNFAQRSMALSDPKGYEAARSTALGELKDAAAATFKNTFKMYGAAGYGVDEAKKLAVAASKQTYDLGLKALRANFPSAADSVFQARKTKRSILLNSSSGASRSAPKTKRKGSKRR